MKKRLIPMIFSGVGILLLILDSRSAMNGAQIGIELCIYTVIPSLFPFMVLTGVLAPAMCSSNSRILRPLSRLTGIPKGCESLFVTGILGGYPTGALSVHQAWCNGQLSGNDAKRMLAFCSNAGPAFLFGMLGSKFPQQWMLWLLWGIHIISALLVGMLLPKNRNIQGNEVSAYVPGFTQSLKNAVAAMAYVCGWIILFRVILAFCDRWFLWLLPKAAQTACYGLLELTNGCAALDQVQSVGARFILCSALLAFGGICVVLQTVSVTRKLGLGAYLPGKVLQTLLSILLSGCVQWICFPAAEKADFPPWHVIILCLSIVTVVFIAGKRKIRGSIPQLLGV